MIETAATLGRGRPRKRAAILRAAVQVFLRDGYDRASVDDIAATADVAKRTIYNHLGDKRALFLAACEDAFARVNADTLAALDTFPDHPSDLETDLITFGKALASCYLNPEAAALRALIHTEAVRHPELIATWRERGPGHVTALLADRLDRLATHGALSIPNPDRAAHHFMALATYEVQTRSTSPVTALARKELDTAVSDGIHTFLRAYAASR